MSERFGIAKLVTGMTVRPARKLFVSVLAMALISFLLIFALLLGKAFELGGFRGAGRLGADILVVPTGTVVTAAAKLLDGLAAGSPLPHGIEGRIASTAGINRVAPLYLFTSAADPCCDMGDILLVGFDPGRDFTVLPWLRPGDGFPVTKQLLAGARVMKAPGAAMRFYGTSFTLAARLQSSGAVAFDKALFIPIDGITAMEQASQRSPNPLVWSREKPSALLIRLEPARDPLQTARKLEKLNPGIQAMTIAESQRSDRQRMERLARVNKPLAAVGWLLSLSLGWLFLLQNSRGRRKNLGLLKAFGYDGKLLATMFAGETAALCLMGMVCGGAGAFLALRLSGRVLALATGLPLTSGWLTEAASPLLWSLPAFMVIMGVGTAISVLLALKNDAAELLRSA